MKKNDTLNSLFSLSGKVAVITGGEGIIGSTIAKTLAKLGVKIGILGINESNAQAVVDEINSQDGEALKLIADVLDVEQLEKAKGTILDSWKRIDILINAAGGNMPGATIGEKQTIFDLKIPDFKKVTDLNLNGTLIPSLVFGEIFSKQKSGNIINISSMASTRVITRVLGYSAAKAAVENLTKWLAVEMAAKFGEGIRVNALAPGFFITHQNRNLLLKDDGSLTDRGKRIIDMTPFKRFGKPEEVLGAVVWLCSRASSFVTGTVIPIDGGFSVFSGV